MTQLWYVGFLAESIGAVGILIFPLGFLMTLKKRFIILSLISLIMLLGGYMTTILQ